MTTMTGAARAVPSGRTVCRANGHHVDSWLARHEGPREPTQSGLHVVRLAADGWHAPYMAAIRENDFLAD